MFDVYGDEIVFEGVKVGRLEGGWPTLRDRVIDGLQGSFEGYVSEGDHAKLVEEASEEGYKSGEADQKFRMSKEIEKAESKGYDLGKHDGMHDGMELGRQAALKESAHAAETERVALLLASCNKVYAILAQGLAKRNPKIKITEARDAMRGVLIELRAAAVAYNKGD